MKKSFLLAATLFVALFINAQPQPVGHLTIFSEDGDKFFLVLNGERQNNIAQTNLRVEDLTQPYYNAKIIFEDQSLMEINKNFLQITDANGVFMDVTYKIKRDKNNTGKMKFNFFSMNPVVQGFVPPANVQVVHFGAPVPAQQQTTVVQTAPVGTVTQTTTTTTTGVGGVGANVNVGGVNMNVSITDPLLGMGVTETTTTRTTTTSSNVVVAQPAPTQPVQVGCVNAMPMSAADFNSALATIRGQGFDDTKLNTAKQIAGSNCLNTNQIVQICQLFGFEESKLDFAKFAYGHCTEPRNYFKVNNVFGFSSSVDELNQFISGH